LQPSSMMWHRFSDRFPVPNTVLISQTFPPLGAMLATGDATRQSSVPCLFAVERAAQPCRIAILEASPQPPTEAMDGRPAPPRGFDSGARFGF
jgi:hypothetical protein